MYYDIKPMCKMGAGKMIIGLSRRDLVRRGKLSLKVLLAVLVALYLLSRLLCAFWDFGGGPNIHEKSVPDKVMQVISQSFFRLNS
jgi:hypothetical protein